MKAKEYAPVAHRGLSGKKILFITSIDPRRMPFVEQQIILLREKGAEVRTLTRVHSVIGESYPGAILDGFSSRPVSFARRLSALFFGSLRGFFEPGYGSFMRDVTDRVTLGYLASGKRMAHWDSILRAVEEWKPDLIHVHFAWHLPFALPLARRLNLPIVCTAHHSDIYFEEGWCRNLLDERVRQVISIAEGVHDYMMENCAALEQKTHLIYNPLNMDFLSPLKPLPSRLRILNVASFKPIKNQAWLVRALSILETRGIEFHCDFAGVGDQFDDVKQQVESNGLGNRVTFHGFKNHSEVLRLMDEASVFVLSSESEGLPTVVTEALARGLPVVCTDLPSTRDATAGGQFAHLITLNDDKGLADAIVSAYAKSADSSRRTIAREWVESAFSHEAHWSKLEGVYARALNRVASSPINDPPA